MMEHRESNLTHRQPSNKASLAWLLVCTVGAALLAVMIATQGALAQDIQDPSNGWFQKCGLAKTGQFDPIVFPHTPPPVGHQHLFFGATAISDLYPDPNADPPYRYSTAMELQTKGSTTCRFKDGTNGGNFSSYWVPDLLLSDGATFVGGKQLNAYYRKGASSVDANVIKPYPDGLKMLIRDSTSSKASVKWYCSNINGEGNNGNMQERPYNCKATGTYPYVTAQITFPQCGNGDIDTTDDTQKYPAGNDHISHMAYPSSSGCPKDHLIVFPRLFVTVKYNTSLGAGALLAASDPDHADPATNFHVDYFEAWQPGRLQFYIDKCIKAGINCNSTPPAG
jgi:Domain of unknown function (DUF1996)